MILMWAPYVPTTSAVTRPYGFARGIQVVMVLNELQPSLVTGATEQI